MEREFIAGILKIGVPQKKMHFIKEAGLVELREVYKMLSFENIQKFDS